MSVYIDRDQLENFAMNCVGGMVTMKQIHDFPGVHVPPHGRLIDADAFKEYIHVSFDQVAPELEGGYKWLAERITKDLLNDIEDAPTIIPADDPRAE